MVFCLVKKFNDCLLMMVTFWCVQAKIVRLMKHSMFCRLCGLHINTSSYRNARYFNSSAISTFCMFVRRADNVDLNVVSEVNLIVTTNPPCCFLVQMSHFPECKEFADLLNHVTSYSSVVVMGDVNLDVQTNTSSFPSLYTISSRSCRRQRTLLDVVAVRSDTTVVSVNVPAPVLSDHSMIDVAFDLCCSNQYESIYHTCHSWRSAVNYDDFERDLRQSTLVCSPPDDVTRLIATYDNTLKSLIDVHAPYRRVHRSTSPSQHWFDAECRAAKWTTRSLEYVYRCCPSMETLSAWKNQFTLQRRLFHEKHLTTGRQHLQAARVMHGSCNTRSTKLSSRQLHLGLHTVRMTWQCISSVRSTRFKANTAAARPSVSRIAYLRLCLRSSW